MIKRAFLALVGLLLFAEVYSQGVVERTVTGIDRVTTEADFYYRGTNIPVLDITYHEFSADGNTWRKGYVSGDCYVRFANTTNNSANPNGTGGGYHSTWWVFNFCEQTGGSNDTIYIVVGGDTIQVNDLTITIPEPETLTGSTTNYQDSVYHTHQIELYINDMLDVDADYIDGYVIKYNEVLRQWIAAPDLIGSGTGGSLRVTEEDNLPSVNGVTEIRVPNSHLINNGNGSVSLILSVSPQLGANDYWRAGIDTSAVEGTHSVVFDTPFSENDYTVVSLFGVYPNKIRQNFVYSNTTVNGFDVLGVMEAEVEIHYLAIRNVDSLLAVMAEMGKVLASPSDMVYGYLANKTDDTTITVTNNQLVVIKAPNADSLGHIPASGYTTLDSLESLLEGEITVGGINTPYIEFSNSILNSPAVPGTIEYSDNKYYVTNVGKQRVIDRTSDVLLSTVTVANTTTPTAVYTTAIDGNDLRVGNIIKVYADGVASTATASEPITIQVYFGSTLIETLSPTLGAVTNTNWSVEAHLTVRSVGVSGQIAIHSKAVIDGNSDEIVALHTVDTTTSNNITIRVTWGAAKTGNTLSIYQGFSEFRN